MLKAILGSFGTRFSKRYFLYSYDFFSTKFSYWCSLWYSMLGSISEFWKKKKKNTKKKKTRKKKQANKFHTPPCGEYEHFHFWKAAGRWGKGYLKYGHRGEQYKMEWFWPSTVLSGLASFDALENFRISAFCKKLLGLSFICQQTICQRFVTKVSFLYS